MNNLDKQKVDKLLSDIKKIEDEFLNDPDISEETKKRWIEDKKKLEEKFKAEEEEYQRWLEANKHKKIIGYNPENFRPIFEDEQPIKSSIPPLPPPPPSRYLKEGHEPPKPKNYPF